MAAALLESDRAGIESADRSAPEGTQSVAELVIRPNMSALVAGQLLMRRQLQNWLQLEAAVRRDSDIESLHRLRVCGRCLMATLQLLQQAPLARARQLRLRLQNLLHFTSAARDLDVQIAFVTSLPELATGSALQPVLQRLRRHRRREQTRLVKRLGAPRSMQLLHSLDGLTVLDAQRQIARPVSAVAGAALRRRHRKLRRQAQEALATGDIESHHALRLQAKKLRYLAEPLVSLYGSPLRRYLRRLHDMQRLLGDMHDAEQLANSLSAQLRAVSLAPATAVALGRLVEQEQARQRELQLLLPAAWRRLRGKCWRRVRRALRIIAHQC